jgi:hypothetical protein
LNTHNLHPLFLTGFADAESCFYIKISRSKNSSTGWIIQPNFQIILHQKDLALLELIRSSLGGVGNIYQNGKDTILYRVSSVKDLRVIIDHFDKYPLITQKLADYLLFKKAYELINRKEHLTIEGLHKIVAIKATMNNNGLSDDLKAAFSNTLPDLDQ